MHVARCADFSGRGAMTIDKANPPFGKRSTVAAAMAGRQFVGG
jgi:hypothetical protein